MVMVMALAGAATPILVSKGVDALGGNLTTDRILLLSLAVLIFGLINWGANWVRRRLTGQITGDIVLALRSDAFQASVQHDLSFYDEYSSGRVVSRISSDTQDFGTTVVLVSDLIAQFIQAIVLGMVLVIIDWRLALILFAMMPVFFLVTLGFRQLAQSHRQGMPPWPMSTRRLGNG
jgi:ATP-binding cassette subfamily B protein